MGRSSFHILCGLTVEPLLATGRAEVVRLALVLAFRRRRLWIDIHTADQILLQGGLLPMIDQGDCVTRSRAFMFGWIEQ